MCPRKGERQPVPGRLSYPAALWRVENRSGGAVQYCFGMPWEYLYLLAVKQFSQVA